MKASGWPVTAAMSLAFLASVAAGYELVSALVLVTPLVASATRGLLRLRRNGDSSERRRLVLGPAAEQEPAAAAEPLRVSVRRGILPA